MNLGPSFKAIQDRFVGSAHIIRKREWPKYINKPGPFRVFRVGGSLPLPAAALAAACKRDLAPAFKFHSLKPGLEAVHISRELEMPSGRTKQSPRLVLT